MHKSWQTKKLGEICEYQRGLTYSKKDEVDFSRNVVLRANNIDLVTNTLNFSELKYIRDDLVLSQEKRVKKGSLIICTASGSKSHLGKVALIDRNYNYLFGGFMGQITPGGEIDSKYLFYILTSNKYIDFISSLSSGVNINNLRFDVLREFVVSYPSLSEQKRLVKILDQAFEKIEKVKENTEQNLENVKELLEAYLLKTFDNKKINWETKKLEEVCEKITDGTHQTPRYFSEGVVFLSSKNVTSGKINWNDIKYIDKKQHQELQKRVSPRFGDVLLAKNGTTGVAAIVDRNITLDIYVSLALLRPNSNLSSPFLLYFINSPMAKKQFNKRLKGIGVPNLHLEEIRQVIIQFPKSIAEQKTIVKSLDVLSDQTNKLEDLHKRKLSDLEELKKSILQKAFSGEL